ncbi:hypothetical protein EIP91_004513 [Steccherinum ochraceum]|uniref:Peptidase A1 domain-containing protein n=1 Tax=Steccherinum ochraceum TaxID=92696 RepID=A0A4R0R9L9_9APHY|nr:hypothetical protein EIP91_004513 [Steccherinum ochraceum]
MQLGNSTTSLILDTGSSDLWVMSDQCTTGTCDSSTSVPYITQPNRRSGGEVHMKFGDSKTRTHAAGPVVFDTVSVAGISMADQPFAAINETDSSAVLNGGAGIFGLGFPSQSLVEAAVINNKFDKPETTDVFVANTASAGPLIARMAMSGELEQPMFAITLQRSTVDIGGNEGALTVGRLPTGVDNSSLTWVPVRLYGPAHGGQDPPSFAADEVYPLRWEVPLEAVYLDDEKLPDTNLTGDVNAKGLSALIDSGNSLLRGPEDVVDHALRMISTQFAADPSADPTFPCSTPHSLSFQIGGQMFPIDPRDFVSRGDATNCTARLIPTDAPHRAHLHSWSLGAPFFRSNLVAFYFGNLTHPSVDPPRIGFLNTVPSNAGQLLRDAVQNATANGGRFPSTLEAAPPVMATIHLPATPMTTTPPPAPTVHTQLRLGLATGSTPSPRQASAASSSFASSVWFSVVLSFTVGLSVVVF